MPIAIEARLSQRAVYFAGETVHCEITVSNKNEKDPKSHEYDNGLVHGDCSDSSSEKTLAWASAQVYCQCHINESRIMPLNDTKRHSTTSSPMTEVETSFIPTRGETGHCLLSTKPVILFCNQSIKKGETKKFTYSEKIPESAPPSYKGQSVRFSYKITIGIGSINGPTKLIRLPIRVLTMEDISTNIQHSNDENDEENPFLENLRIQDHSIVDVYLDRLTYATSQRNYNVYNISCSHGSAGKFSLSKASYRIGEDVQGSFDFTDSSVRCIKYKVALQSEESVSDGYQKKGIKHRTPYTSYSKYEECCINCRQTNFSLPIPITATPEFTSKIVSLRWRIHCEFTTSSSATDQTKTLNEGRSDPKMLDDGLLEPRNEDTAMERNTCEIAKDLTVDTMTWDVPVKIVASNPVQVSLMSFPNLDVCDIFR